MKTEKSLTIKQVAQLYNVSIDTLRYYEELGIVAPERDPRNGYRRYREQDFGNGFQPREDQGVP